jgi:hypothetical protein
MEKNDMAENGVWPVVFVAWRSKADEAMEASRKGQFDAWTGSFHARKGAPCVVVTEGGKVLAVGEVVSVAKYTHELSLEGVASGLDDAPQITNEWLEKLKAVPNGFLKRPISAVFVPPDKEDATLIMQRLTDPDFNVELELRRLVL